MNRSRINTAHVMDDRNYYGMVGVMEGLYDLYPLSSSLIFASSAEICLIE